MEDSTRPIPARLAAGTSEAVLKVFAEHPFREYISPSPDYPLLVQRKLALFSAWYEFFPRSEGARFNAKTGKWESGTLRNAAQSLTDIAVMGFYITYFTPITTHCTNFHH